MTLKNTRTPLLCIFSFVHHFIAIYKFKLNTLRPRRNGQHFADDIFKRIFFNETIWIKTSLKFVPKVRINNITALVQITAWRRPGHKPLSEPMMVRVPTHICVTRPQWVKLCSQETLNLGQNRHFFVPCGREILWMTFKNNRTPLLSCFKICASFHSHQWILTGVTVRKHPIWAKIDVFVPCDREIWQMTLRNNSAPLLCHFKRWASFQSHQ